MGVKTEDYLFSSGVFPFLAWVATVLKSPFLGHFRFVTRVDETKDYPGRSPITFVSIGLNLKKICSPESIELECVQ